MSNEKAFSSSGFSDDHHEHVAPVLLGSQAYHSTQQPHQTPADSRVDSISSTLIPQQQLAGEHGAADIDSKNPDSKEAHHHADADLEIGHASSEGDKRAEGEGAGSGEEGATSKILTGWKLVWVFSAMLLSVLLIALDQTIVATALPVIASQFNALDQITWIVSAYFLTQAPLILVYGQLLTIFPTKWVFLIAVTLFEIGSLICGVAPSSEVLIFGRAFAGVGAAGIFVSILSIIAEITKLEDRPKLFGAFGAVFALSSVVGPLLGGVFTDHATWRWCFYINLPIGAITVAAILFFVKASQPPKMIPRGQEGYLSPWKKCARLDWIGAILVLGVTTCLILPLQEGGISKPWNSGSVIAELVVFGVLVLIFVAWEFRVGEKAILPLHLFKRRSIVGACIASFFLMMVMLSGTYYLPLFYQAVKEHTPTKSGVDILPFMMAVVLTSMGAGIIISITGHYYPFLVFGPAFTPIGGGLLYTVTQFTSTAKLVGYQILLGSGVGLAFQNTVIAVQAELHQNPDLVPQGTALVTFFQLIGGVIGISISGTLFNNQLASELGKLGIDSSIIAAVKVTVEAIFALEGELKEVVLAGYVRALRTIFLVAVPAGIIAALGAALIRPLNLKKIGGMAALGPA